MDVITGSDAPTGAPATRAASMRVSTADSTMPMPAASSVLGGNQGDLKPAWCLLAAPVAIGFAVAGVVVSLDADGPTATQIVGVILVALWAAAGVALGVRRRQDRLGPIVLAGAIAGGATCLAEALVASARLDDSTDDLAAIALRLGLTLLPAFALHLLVALPDGRLTSRARQRSVVAGYVVGLVVGGLLCARPRHRRDLADRRALDRRARRQASTRRRCATASPVRSSAAACSGSAGDSPSQPKACSS